MPFEILEATFNLSRDLKFGYEPNLGDIERVYDWVDDWMNRRAKHDVYTDECIQKKESM